MKTWICWAGLFLGACMGVNAQVTLSGYITDKQTGQPIAAARIEVADLTQVQTSDAAGFFQWTQLPAGVHTFQITAPGYHPWEQTLRLSASVTLQIRLLEAVALTEAVQITALRATEQTGTTYNTLTAADISRINYGQDIPLLLDQLPSTVANSDAGTGIGYTGIRIRGSDPTRTNVTINGIALNDPESHGVFWVNLPDLASSVDNIQVQRGVGTSTNGPAAFGASINIQTQSLSYEPYASYEGGAGAFNTWRHSLRAGTGLINGRFALDTRLSSITSDGWVDRAFSDLKSLFAAAGWYGDRSALKAVMLRGKEQTYQSWWGIPEAYLDDPTLRRSNYYTYENETDNYQQDHYQLLYSLAPTPALSLNAALHYTWGRGYYEQYRAGDALAAYGLPPVIAGTDTIATSDLIRRRWLNNHYYGFTFSAQYQPISSLQLTLGGAGNQYDGEHFGELIWARFASVSEIRDRYYESFSQKRDGNVYLKALWHPAAQVSVYGDLQIRHIGYQLGDSSLTGAGTDQGGAPVSGDYRYLFVNPKAGITWQVHTKTQLYASYSIANREPVRSDFIDAPQGRTPTHETLYNAEAGLRYRSPRWQATLTGYHMRYHNQLVLNGEINDVGASVRQNVPESYRAGIELEIGWQLHPSLTLTANTTLSRNRIAVFEEYLYNYDPYELEVIRHENTVIAFSPALTAGSTLTWEPVSGLRFSWTSKYVGRQYLDNTTNLNRSLDPFFVQHLQGDYAWRTPWAQELTLGIRVNNLTNVAYEPNGYTFSYKVGPDLYTENYYYPQAGLHVMGRVGVKF